MKKLTLLFALALLITSCSKNSHLELSNLNSEESIPVLLEIKAKVIDGVLTFSTDKDLLNFIKLDIRDKEDFLIKYEFIPYHQHLQNIHQQFDELNSVEEFKTLVDKYPNDLEINENKYGELELENKVHENNLYYNISNLDRIYGIGEKLFKLSGSHVLKSNKDQIHHLKRFEHNTINNSNMEIEIYNRKGHGITDLRYDVYSFERINDNPYCKNDRKIIMELSFDELFLSGSNYLTSYYWVKARKRGIPCVWYAYNTYITIEKVDIETISHDNYQDYHEFSSEFIYGSSFTKDHPIASFTGNYYDNQTFIEPRYSFFHFKVTHQGMDGNYLELYYAE